MSEREKIKWQAKGLMACRNAEILHPDLRDFEVFRRTLGFYQWKTKNALTDEQLIEFEKGFRLNVSTAPL